MIHQSKYPFSYLRYLLFTALFFSILLIFFISKPSAIEAANYRFPTAVANHKIEKGYGFADYVEEWRDCDNNFVQKVQKHHAGVDVINTTVGCDTVPADDPIYPMTAGTVVSATFSSTDGWIIIVDHDLDEYYSAYWHVQRDGAPPNRVDTNTPLGKFGNYSNNPHLHFELRTSATVGNGYTVEDPAIMTSYGYLNPCKYLRDKGVQVPQSCFDIQGTVKYPNGNLVTSGNIYYLENSTDTHYTYATTIGSNGKYYLSGDIKEGAHVLQAYDTTGQGVVKSITTVIDPLPNNRNLTLDNTCGFGQLGSFSLLAEQEEKQFVIPGGFILDPCQQLPPPTSNSDGAQFVTDVTIPDGTDINPNQTFTKIWRLKNTGTTTWSTGYKLKFQSGSQMSAPNKVSIPNSVAPNQQVDIAVNMTSPTTAGNYRGYWKMTNSNGQLFGDIVWVDIDVMAATSDGATFVADITIPDGTDMAPNQAFTKIWRIRNSGTTTWSSSYKLAFQSGTQMGAPSEVSLPNSVAPNQEVDISVNMTAPSSAGNYQGNWKMKNASGQTFGDLVWVNIDVVVAANDNAKFLLDVTIPDGTDMTPGQTFTKTWRFRNTGTTTWTTAYKLAFQSGDQMSGPVEVSIPKNVLPSRTVDVSVTLTAPMTSGNYRGYWKIKNPAGQTFGDLVWVDIDVIAPTTDNAAFVTDVTIPDGTDLNPNQSFTKIWRIRNSGTTTWTTGYKIAFQSGAQMSAPSEVSLTSNVAPNQEVDLAVNMTAPSSAGNYQGNWKMKNTSGQTFGDLVWVNIDVVNSTDSATFVADITIPDGTDLNPNQTFTKIWRIRNSGNTTWDGSYKLAFQSGSQMGGPALINLPGNVAPNQEVDISVGLTAPSTPGNYQGNWKMRNASGQTFGDLVWVNIDVVQPSSGLKMFKRMNSNFAVNAFSPSQGSNVDVWTYNTSDPDQWWKLISDDRIQRNGTNYCLNTPHRFNGGNVFLWTCDSSDADQKWEFISDNRIRLKNTNFCLNAHNQFNGGNVDIWTCDSSDPDQKFEVINL